jgi:hypothetical protein
MLLQQRDLFVITDQIREFKCSALHKHNSRTALYKDLRSIWYCHRLGIIVETKKREEINKTLQAMGLQVYGSP